jgi:hypothetical protein
MSSETSPISHTKAFLIWRCIQAPGLLRVEDTDRLMALLEDYVCFPYRNDADIEVAMELAIRIAEAPYEQSKITERLINYLLGKEAE